MRNQRPTARPRLLTPQQVLQAEDLATRAVGHEATLLACAMHNPHVASKVLAELADEDFAHEPHRLIFAAIRACAERNTRPTRLAVEDMLKRHDAIDLVGYTYLEELADGIPMIAAAPHAIEQVLEVSKRRQLLRAAREVAAKAIDLACEDPVGEGFAALLSVNEKRAEEHVRHVSDVMRAQVTSIQAAHDAAAAGRSALARSGYGDLDSTVILGAGKLLILAARPGMGKSALAWGMATNVARERVVLLATLEMAGEEIASRQIAADLRLSAIAQAAGQVKTRAEWEALYALPNRYDDLKLYIDDAPAATIASIQGAAQRVAAKTGEPVGLVVVDYLGLLDAEGENDTSKVAAISRAAKRMAKTLRCPVIMLAQLNRQVEQRSDKRPMLADLRQSGAIEQDADAVLFVYRDEYYHPDTTEKGVAEVIVAKNRGGASNFVFKLLWRPHETRFYSLGAGAPMSGAGYLGD